MTGEIRPVSIGGVDPQIGLRHLRYFVAVAEELHFGRAAERLHMSQSPLSRAIRELERDLDVTLFVRTTRRVELTPAGAALLEGSRRALAELDAAIDGARRTGRHAGERAAIGHGPLSRGVAARLVEGQEMHLEEGVTPELLARVAANELPAAAVLATPAAARRHGVRIDPLCDEPLLAAVPSGHRHAEAGAIPLEVFAAERVLLPREPAGASFNAWLRAVLRAAGHELEDTIETLSAAWDRRMLPVARGEAVSVFVADWAEPPIPGVEAIAFDPPLTFPIDLASGKDADAIVERALRLRDRDGWLTTRAPALSRDGS